MPVDLSSTQIIWAQLKTRINSLNLDEDKFLAIENKELIMIDKSHQLTKKC